MFSSPASLVLLPIHNLGWLIRRRPVISALCGLSALALLSWLGVYYWYHVPLWQARRALDLDLLPEAAAAMASYLQRMPNDAAAYLLACRIERLRGNPVAAEKHLEDYKRLAGSTDRSQLEWLLLRAMAGELAEVEPGLLYALNRKEPQSILILEALIFSHLKEYHFAIARHYAEKWLEQEPDCVRALDWRGVARENLNSLAEARDDYLQVLELSPKHDNARIRLVYLLLTEKNVTGATEHLKILQQSRADHPEVLIALAECRTLQGKSEEAISILNGLLSRQPDNARALHKRGQLAPALAEQEKWFRQALKIDPTYFEARYSLYSCLMNQPDRRQEAQAEKKKYDVARNSWIDFKKILEALERKPRDPDLLVKAGSLVLFRNPSIGLEFLYKALALAPAHQQAHETLARYFEKTQQPEKAALHRSKLSSGK